MEYNKQQEIYNFLKEYTEDTGYPPTVREICDAVSLRSTSTVQGHLERLQKKGLIKRNPSKPRALEIIELSEAKKEMIDIPVIKGYRAGMNLLDKENISEMFKIPNNFISDDKEIFMVKVEDEGMMKSGIITNDLAIIERNDIAEDNMAVLVYVNSSLIIRDKLQ
ncbi:transcriptional repressor LexA [uncultured Clostridium sp.]|uniref:transcriptional repressor LexA n=1 Tax=uncultured Clostridium sp. TaxID=59620 RepID=UPI0025FE5B0A|nr:transcriptional repressor LexA [uncultured Clostridium sp.]